MTAHWSAVKEAANHLGVDQDSIYRWIEARGLPAVSLAMPEEESA